MTAWKAIDRATTALCELAEELQITPRERLDGDLIAGQLWAISQALEGGRDRGDEDDTRSDPEAIISALRLAMFGSDNDHTRVEITKSLLLCAPDTADEDTEGPGLLCELISNGVVTATVPA